MRGKLGETKLKFDMVIVDAMNICRKMEWVFRVLKDSQERPTGVLYGVVNYARSLKFKFRTKIVFAWDSPPEHKRELDETYKANRPKLKSVGYWEQIRELKIMLSLYGVTQYYAPGYEADDVAAKLVHDNSGKKILLVSADHDWLQMLEEERVFVLSNNEVKSRSVMEKECELDLGSFVRFKAIVGDRKNNVLGIPKIPKKTAWALVKRFKNFDTMFRYCEKNLSENKWYNAVLEFAGQIRKNFLLIELVDKDYKIEKIKAVDDRQKLISMLRDHDMYKLIERIEI